jgi:hypothetical protein
MAHLTPTDRKHMLIGACIMLASMGLGILLNLTAPDTMAPIHDSLDRVLDQFVNTE